MTNNVLRCCVLLSSLCLASACKGERSNMPGDEDLTDAQVITALVAIHQGEIDAARVAVQKSSDAEVQGFATRMQSEHGAAIDRLEAIASAHALTPEGSNLSMMVERESGDLGRELAQAEGRELDRLYARSQLEGHREVLRTLDEMLLPEIHARDLRTEVEAQREAVVGHIEHAERLERAVQNAQSTNADDAADSGSAATNATP